MYETDSRFDRESFYSALDAIRAGRRITWREVAREAGVSASTLTRIGQGAYPDVDRFAALLAWSNLSADRFLGLREQSNADTVQAIIRLLQEDTRLMAGDAEMIGGVVARIYHALRNDNETATDLDAALGGHAKSNGAPDEIRRTQ